MNISPLALTKGIVKSVDQILADIKKAGRGWQFKTNQQIEDQRQVWVTMAFKTIAEELRNAETKNSR